MRLKVYLDPERRCRKEGCDAPLMKGFQSLLSVERGAPRFADGTSNLFSPRFQVGEITLRVVLLDETCAEGHRAQWERHIPVGGVPFDLPPTFVDPTVVLDDDYWKLQYQ